MVQCGWPHARVPALYGRTQTGCPLLVELDTDGRTRSGAEHPTRAARIKLDTTLTQFATGACIGGEYVPPRPLRGSHEIKFLIKRDGNPCRGPQTQHLSTNPPDLPCHGNGDDDFTYALFEDNIANFTGTR